MSHPPSLGTHPGFDKLSFLLAPHEDHWAPEQRGVREADLGRGFVSVSGGSGSI